MTGRFLATFILALTLTPSTRAEKLSARMGFKVAATNDCHYLQQDDCCADELQSTTRSTADSALTATVTAEVIGGTATTTPIGEQGTLASGGATGMIFSYDGSYWALPYSWITNIKLTDVPLGFSLMTVTFEGARGEDETVTFRLSRQMALVAASNLSARSSAPIAYIRE